MWLRKSTASQQILLGPFLDSTDGVTAKTALTIANTDIKLWVEGGTTEASKTSGGATHIASGRYYAVLDATDTATLGKLEINVAVAGALPVRREFMVLPAVVYDAIVLGTDNLDVSAVQFAGQAITCGGGVTIPAATLASTTNITAATGIVLSGVTHTGAVIPTVTTTGTATNLTNLPTIPANWLTAAGIAASALDGKGNWNIGKTGYTLTQAFPANFAVMSISAATGLVDITQAAADKAWSTAARVLTAGTNIALAKGTGVTGFNDLDAAGVAAATWNAATITYGAAGSYGLLIETNLDAPVSGATAPTAAAVADAVWDEVLSGHLTAGTTGNALNAAGAAGDPWTTALPGAYGAGTAGKIIGDNINATISSRLAAAGYTAPDNASITTILADTNDIQTRLPAALVAGRMDASVGAMAANVVTASALAADAVTEIINALYEEPVASHLTAGTYGLYMAIAGGILVDTVATGTPTATEIKFTGGVNASNFYADQTVWIMAGTGLGQNKPILSSSYLAGTTTLTLDESCAIAPAVGDRILIKADHVHPLSQIRSGLATAASIAALNNLSAAQVNAEMLDVLATDTFAELAAIPAATSSLKDKITFAFMLARNQLEQTATTATLRRDDAVTAAGTATVSDNGTTAIRGEWT